jgi:hypothetical protein
MALADYFHRSAVAAAQVLAGFDEDSLADRLTSTTVEVCVGEPSTKDVVSTLDMVVRLLARFYPTLSFSGESNHVAHYAKLAREINPNIEIVNDHADYGISVGTNPYPRCTQPVFAGSKGWDALTSFERPFRSADETSNPFGSGAAACLAVGEVFRQVFGVGDEPSGDVVLSTLDLASEPSAENVPLERADIGQSVLVGVGAIGNAIVWALGRTSLRGTLHLVDHQQVELSNVQRYVLCGRSDENQSKVNLAARFLQGELLSVTHEMDWAHFVEAEGHRWSRVLVALDSAQGRRDVQASLPQWIANAWTQPGDLGVSVHPWTKDGACLACLYLPVGPTAGEDRLIGDALGLNSDIELLNVRRLLHNNAPLPPELFDQVSAYLGVSVQELSAFSDRPLRTLYVEGLCGGALLPLNRIGQPTQELHVPIAHQSALAGILLASRLAAKTMGRDEDATRITRIDVLRTLGTHLSQPMQKDARGICICQDRTYEDVFQMKYGAA